MEDTVQREDRMQRDLGDRRRLPVGGIRHLDYRRGKHHARNEQHVISMIRQATMVATLAFST
jgi:hypothetical protein